MTLAEKLTDLRAGSVERHSSETREKMHRATDELRASGILDTALKTGDKMPEFILPNMNGKLISSKDLLDQGNLVLTFYRGVW